MGRDQELSQGFADAAQPLRGHWLSFLVYSQGAVRMFLAIGVLTQLRNLREFMAVDTAKAAGVLGLIILGTFLAGSVYGLIMWYFARYWVAEGALHYTDGIVSRNHRRVALMRIQAIDMTAPLLARLLGLVEVRVETAGSSDSHVSLRYLQRDAAERVRAQLLHLAADARLSAGESGAGDSEPAGQAGGQGDRSGGNGQAPGPEPKAGAAAATPTGAASGRTQTPATGPAPDLGPKSNQISDPISDPIADPRQVQTVIRIPATRLLAASLLSPGVVFVFLAWLAVTVPVTVALLSVGWNFDPSSIEFWLQFLPQVSTFLLPVLYVYQTVSTNWKLRVEVCPDGIRLRRGLTTTRSQTIPPNRIHGVKLSQGWLWRQFGWWKVTLSVAGWAMGENGKTTSMPIGVELVVAGTEADALRALWLVMPDLGEENPGQVLAEGMHGEGPSPQFTPIHEPAWWLMPVQHSRYGWRLNSRVLFVRACRFGRNLVIVDHSRLQEIATTQGPLQRRVGAVTTIGAVVDLAVSPTVKHLSAAQGAWLRDQLHQLARNERAHDESPRALLERVSAAPQQAAAAPPGPATGVAAAPNAAAASGQSGTGSV